MCIHVYATNGIYAGSNVVVVIVGIVLTVVGRFQHAGYNH